MMEVRPRLEKINSDKTYCKNKLYRIDGSFRLPVSEEHEDGQKETVVLEYELDEHQFGIFAHECRN